VCESQAPECVAREAVHSRLIKEDLRLECEDFVERVTEFGEVDVVGSLVFEFDIQTTALLAKRKILATVQRQREDQWIIFKNLCRAVSLMYVAIDDGDTLDIAFMSQPKSRDGNVIEYAETASLAAKGVMRASGEIASESTIESVLRSTEGSAYAGQRAANKNF
jgi:hypothetical protein